MTYEPKDSTLGARLRSLREARGQPLRLVAAAADMDSTLLSKIELGERLPTKPQTALLAAYFNIPPDELEAARISEKFLREHGDNPAIGDAVAMIRERAPAYVVYNPVHKPVKKRQRKS